jgi:hypothetical protein
MYEPDRILLLTLVCTCSDHRLLLEAYEDLVEKHMVAASNVAGDLAHFNPFFPLWHRLWLLELEDSLISVDSSIQGLAYWYFCRSRVLQPIIK